MNKDSGSEIADEGKSSGESNPESRRVPVTEPDAFYQVTFDDDAITFRMIKNGRVASGICFHRPPKPIPNRSTPQLTGPCHASP